MGAAYSPTIANIFMSVILHNFLQTQENQPVLLTRYIDDIIFIIWPNEHTLNTFLQALNKLKIYPHQFQLVCRFLRPNNLQRTRLPSNPSVRSQIISETTKSLSVPGLYFSSSQTYTCTVYRWMVLGECARYLRSKPTYYFLHFGARYQVDYVR